MDAHSSTRPQVPVPRLNAALEHASATSGPSDCRHSGIDGCLSLLDRYNRLRITLFPGRRGEDASPTDSSPDFTSTKRPLSTILGSGELPTPGTRLHLGQETLEIFRPMDTSLEDSGIEQEHSMIPHAVQIPTSSETYDLEKLNKEWLKNGWKEFRLGPEDIRVEDSESDSEMTLNNIGPSTSQSQALVPTVTHSTLSRSMRTIPSIEELLSILRNGDFSLVCTALKATRKMCNEPTTSLGDDPSIYWEAEETVVSEWTDYTMRNGLMHRRRLTYHTAFNTTIGSSFKTCEPFFEDDSEVDYQATRCRGRLPCDFGYCCNTIASMAPQRPPVTNCVAVITRIPSDQFEELAGRDRRDQRIGPLGMIRRICRAFQRSQEVMDITIISEEDETENDSSVELSTS